MTEFNKGRVNDGVVYPPRCEGVCSLPGDLIDMAGGVLARNCPGPRTALAGEARVAVLSTENGVIGAEITFDAGGNRYCQNPTVARVSRDLVDRTIGSLPRQ